MYRIFTHSEQEIFLHRQQLLADICFPAAENQRLVTNVIEKEFGILVHLFVKVISICYYYDSEVSVFHDGYSVFYNGYSDQVTEG